MYILFVFYLLYLIPYININYYFLYYFLSVNILYYFAKNIDIISSFLFLLILGIKLYYMTYLHIGHFLPNIFIHYFIHFIQK